MSLSSKSVWLVRHADTEWSRSGQHTSRTDLPLLPEGEISAQKLRAPLAAEHFAVALSSPLQRAMRTAILCAVTPSPVVCADLTEWDYGEYEGLTTAQIQQRRSGWDLWADGCPGGESLEQVAARCARVIRRITEVDGDVICFAHGHVLRVLVACWLQLPPSRGRSFGLRPGSISVLGSEHGNRVVWEWDRTP